MPLLKEHPLEKNRFCIHVMIRFLESSNFFFRSDPGFPLDSFFRAR
jgi:hypothetical protein